MAILFWWIALFCRCTETTVDCWSKNSFKKKGMRHVANEIGKIIFLDAPESTGRTFLLDLILDEVRSKNENAPSVAPSEIASTQLIDRNTAHWVLKLSLNVHHTETPTCNIGTNSGMVVVLKASSLIAWDQCTMTYEKYFKALDRTLEDFRENDWPMGGVYCFLLMKLCQRFQDEHHSTNKCMFERVMSLKTCEDIYIVEKYMCPFA